MILEALPMTVLEMGKPRASGDDPIILAAPHGDTL